MATRAPSEGRTAPHNHEAEVAVLGAIVTDQTCIAEVMETVTPDDFDREAHRLIYSAMLRLYERGEAPDVVTLAAELERAGDLEHVGGPATLATLRGDSGMAVQYARIVARMGLNRRIIAAGAKIAELGHENSANVTETLQRAWLELRGVGSPRERTKFDKAGFRSYKLTAPDGAWTLALSRVDATASDPKGLIEVYAHGHPAANEDLGDYVTCRSIGLYGGTNQSQLAKDLKARLGDTEEQWKARLDALIRRTLRASQSAGESVEVGMARPSDREWLFRRRLAIGLTFSLFGPGNAGKTTITDALAVSAASGGEIIPGWMPTRKFRTLILDWDESPAEADIRQYAIRSAYGVNGSKPIYKHMRRPIADSADEAGRIICDEGIEFLILGPVKRALREQPGDPAGPVNELYDVLAEFGTTNLLVDHVVGALSSNKQFAEREYGSVSKRDNARTSYSLYEQSPGVGSRVIVMRQTKRDPLMPGQPPQAIRIEYDPPDPGDAGVYDAIRFFEDEVREEAPNSRAAPMGRNQVEKFIALLQEEGSLHRDKIAAALGCDANYVRILAAKARKQHYSIHYFEDTYTLRSTEE